VINHQASRKTHEKDGRQPCGISEKTIEMSSLQLLTVNFLSRKTAEKKMNEAVVAPLDTPRAH